MSKENSVELMLAYDLGFRKGRLNRIVTALPDVYIMDYSLMHMLSADPLDHSFEQQFHENMTKRFLEVNITKLIPTCIFQSARDNHGMRDPRFVSESIRQANNVLRKGFVDVLGFEELDEYWLTEGLAEYYLKSDGWHFDYDGKCFLVMLCYM